MSLLGEDGMPDKGKLQAKAQGYFNSMFGSTYTKLQNEFLDADLEGGLEIQVFCCVVLGSNVVITLFVPQYVAEVKDPWLLDDDDDEGNNDMSVHKRNISKAEKELTDVQ